MKKQISLAVLFLATTFSVFGAEKELFKEDKLIKTAKRHIALAQAGIPVTPDKKYKISFSASTNSPNTLEDNVRIRIMNLRYTASRVRLKFYDEKGKSLKYLDIYIKSKNLHTYVEVFYPPVTAKSLKIFLIPNKTGDISVEKLAVSTDLEGKESECLNPHPTFEYGDLNTYGYSIGYGGRFFTQPDGKVIWKTGFLGYSQSFPVKENTFYTVFCKGRKYRGRKSYMMLECFKAKARRPFKTMRIAFSEKGTDTVVKMPTGTVLSKLRCYCVIVEEFKVTEGKK